MLKDKNSSSIIGIDRKMLTNINFVPVMIKDKMSPVLPMQTLINVPILQRALGNGPTTARTWSNPNPPT